MEFTYKDFEAEIEESSEELEEAFAEKDYIKTLRYVRFLAKTHYMLNCKMSDDRLEEILRQTSLELLGATCIANADVNTVVFYDGIGMLNRGLADIYIAALAKLGYQIVWIMHDKGSGKEPYVQKQCEKYGHIENIRVCVIPSCPIRERMVFLRNYIRDAGAKHIFFYGHPDDICGAGTFATIGGDVTKYYIDLGDHAFWIGKCAVDYIIGFRNYGYNIATQYRGIAANRIALLPYYPCKRDDFPFEGMPFDTEKYEYVFSGGQPYKIEGDPTYQEMAEYILTKYPALKFVYAAKGTNDILDYLEKTYPGQFFRISERNDLDEILKRAKLYLGTYPITGGLMIQYAVENKCVTCCLGQEPNSAVDPATFLLYPEKTKSVFYQKDELLQEVDRLFTDERYCEEAKSKLGGQVITEEEFVEELQRIITMQETKYEKKDMPIDLARFFEVYRKKAGLGLFRKILRDSHNEWVNRKYPEIMKEIDNR